MLKNNNQFWITNLKFNIFSSSNLPPTSFSFLTFLPRQETEMRSRGGKYHEVYATCMFTLDYASCMKLYHCGSLVVGPSLIPGENIKMQFKVIKSLPQFLIFFLDISNQIIQTWNIKGLHHPAAEIKKIWVCGKISVPLMDYGRNVILFLHSFLILNINLLLKCNSMKK